MTPFDDALYQVLQTRRYDRLTGRTTSLRDTIAQRAWQLMDSLLERFDFTLSGDSAVRPDIIVLLFMVLGGVLLGVAGIVLLRMLLATRKAEVHDLSDIFEELERRAYTVAELLHLAHQAHLTGDMRVAVRYGYIAVLLALNERQVITIRPSATNALILRELQEKDPAQVPSFAAVADTYHRVWFGHKPIPPDAYAQFTTQAGGLIGGEGASHAAYA